MRRREFITALGVAAGHRSCCDHYPRDAERKGGDNHNSNHLLDWHRPGRGGNCHQS
jgi:hypothetical protein